MLALALASTPLLNPSASATLGPPSPVIAVQEEIFGPDRDDLLINFNANYRYSHAGSPSAGFDETESVQARLGLGWFTSRVHEFGFEFAPSYVRAEGGGDATDLYLGPYYNYNYWSSPRTTLYGGAHLGLTLLDSSGSSSETAFGWGLQGGVRYWLSRNVSINLEPRLTFTSLSDSFGGDTSTLDLFIGLGVKL